MYEAAEYRHCVVIVRKLNAQGRPHANPGVSCTLCESKLCGGPFRIRGHILGIAKSGGGRCTSDTPAAQDARAYFQKVEDDFEAAKEKRRKREELDELTHVSRTGTSDGSLKQQSIQAALAPGLKQKADAAFGRWSYADGRPFLKSESVYLQEFLTVVGEYGRGYAPPSVKKLRSNLLDDEVHNVRQRLQVRGHDQKVPSLPE